MLKPKQTSMQYAIQELELIKYKLTRHKVLFALFNGLIFMGTATIAILTSLMISKLIVTKIPEWFFISTTAITAGAVLMTSFINFFSLNQKIKLEKNNITKIESEIWKYKNKITSSYKGKDANFELFKSIEIVKDNIFAEGEN